MLDFVPIAPVQETPPPPPIADARELLARFAATGEQDAFEEVVRRYGGMVFNLCYEVTGNRHDAEDAVQAAFLSLAVQTRSGPAVQAIGPWLQQVARRMSLDINRSRKRRKNREDKHAKAWETRLTELGDENNGGGSSGHGSPSSIVGWDEVRKVVQEELGTLAPKYRMPLILHYYGGLSRDEMARELNCRANTLGVRLHRGREMLAKKLAKRGVMLSGVLIGVMLEEICRTIVTEHLVSSTAHAAVLFSAGHTYACGLVSPQIVALAQRASLALANAKIRFAASLALLAGGAAAAGAQVVSHVGWALPGKFKDITNFFRRVSPPANPGNWPSFQVNGGTSKPPTVAQDNSGRLPIPPSNSSQNLNPSRQAILWKSPIGGNIRLPQIGWENLSTAPGAVRRDDLGYPGDAPSYIVRSLPKNGDISVTGNGGGNTGNNGTLNRSQQDLANTKDIKDPKTDSPPDRGGVKQHPSGIVRDDSTNKSKSISPDGRGVGSDGGGGVTHPFPVPPRLDIDRAPIQGPGVFQPPPPNPDAVEIDHGPIPAGDGPPHGGFLSDDVLHISTDYNPAGAESFDQILKQAIGPANFQLGPGDLVKNGQVIVGHLGTGVATQTGGLHTVDSLYLGVIKTGRGMYQLTGGELSVTAGPNDPDAAAHTIEIGSAGEGLFLLGNADSTGKITQSGDGGGVNLTVAAIRSAKGTLRGWGTVALTGQLSNNGQIIADGYGQDRTLDLSTFATVTNDFANRDTRGWFAVNHGQLALPAIPVASGTNTYTWGGNGDDAKLTLVNSARITLHDVEGDGVMKIALQALDRSDLPALPQGHHFIGIWSFDAEDQSGNSLTADGGMDLQVRYDDALAAQLGLNEGVLKLWKYDGQWERLDFDPTFVRDSADHMLSVHTGIEGMSYFAVSAPEPGSMVMVAVGAGLALGMRRRRK